MIEALRDDECVSLRWHRVHPQITRRMRVPQGSIADSPLIQVREEHGPDGKTATLVRECLVRFHALEPHNFHLSIFKAKVSRHILKRHSFLIVSVLWFKVTILQS